MLEAALRRERVIRDELPAAVRASGRAGIAQVEAVVLESDGSLTVIGPPAESGAAALDAVEQPPHAQDTARPLP